MSVVKLLQSRGETHGKFEDNAHNGQALRELFRASPGWASMPEIHREALDMMAGKLARILSGQSLHADHFRDLAGYATLALEACDPDPALPLVSMPSGVMGADGNWYPRYD